MTPLAALTPLPRRPIPHPLQPRNAGNTCYLSASVVALFADHDAADALLQNNHIPDNKYRLVHSLISIINPLRKGALASSQLFQSLRTALQQHEWYQGRAQHDAAELFAHLMDLLNAPYIPLIKMILHDSTPEPADISPFTERLLWLYPTSESSLEHLLTHFFCHGKLTGIRRGGVITDATVRQTLIPFYTSQRETGESTQITRDSFSVVLIPLAIARFSPTGGKNTATVHVSTAIRAVNYITPPNKLPYTLILRSIICHLGASIAHGHYVSYTYAPEIGWRRWDDLAPGQVETVRGDVETGLPENRRWTREIERNCYICFYELVPGEYELDAIKWRERKQMPQFSDLTSISSTDSDTLFARYLQSQEDEKLARRMEHSTSSVDDSTDADQCDRSNPSHHDHKQDP